MLVNECVCRGWVVGGVSWGRSEVVKGQGILPGQMTICKMTRV